MRDKRRPLSLLVALSTVLLCQASQVRDVRPASQQEEQPKTSLPIDILGLQANKDVAIMFGLGLFNDIHTRMDQCRDERNKIEAKYTNQSKRMQQYYNETERVILKSRAQFEELVHENSEAIEANFEKAFRELEKSRDRKLKRLEAKCSQTMSSFLEGRMKEAVTYASSLMAQDPVAFTRLTFDASSYANQLRAMLPMCSQGNKKPHPPPIKGTVNPDGNGAMNFDLCYVSEIRQIISFIDHFLAQADELRQQYYGDDEDFYDAIIDDKEENLSGDFPADSFDPELEKPTPTQTLATNARPTVHESMNVPISGIFEPGPVIPGKPEDKRPHDNEKPTPAGGTPLPDMNIPIDEILEPGPAIPDKPEDGESHNDDDDKDKKLTPTGDTPSSKPPPPPKEPTSPVVPIDDLLKPGLVKIITEKNETPLPTKETPSNEPAEITGSKPPKPDDEEESDYDGDEKKVTEFPTKEALPTMDVKPTHERPQWFNEAFDDVIGPEAGEQNKDEANEQYVLEEEKELRIPARSRSKSTSEGDEEEGPHYHGNIDLSLPGVNVEIGSDRVDIEANIGQQGGGPSLNIGGSIVFDDNPELTTAGSPEDEDNSFITYMLIYFFATLGSLLLLTILVLSIAIVVLRLKNSRTPKDTPLLSEEDKIAVMKQTGYVNPTYKFFDSNVKDV